MSPKRCGRLFMDPGGIANSPPFKDAMMYPWNWGFGAQNAALSPGSSCGSPESDTDRDFKLRRGRPRADKISSLIVEGSNTASNIRCTICSRVFPREKSLQAHLRTHTGKWFVFPVFTFSLTLRDGHTKNCTQLHTTAYNCTQLHTTAYNCTQPLNSITLT